MFSIAILIPFAFPRFTSAFPIAFLAFFLKPLMHRQRSYIIIIIIIPNRSSTAGVVKAIKLSSQAARGIQAETRNFNPSPKAQFYIN